MDERELAILEIIRDGDGPVGSWSLVDLLAEKGVVTSPSTVGRVLNRLEKLGYVGKKRVNKGRTITQEGLQKIASMYHQRQLQQVSERLGDVLSRKTLERYLMILEARKVIERATARLAATHATAKDVKTLAEVVRRRAALLKEGKSISNCDIEFHSTVAKASGNYVIEMLYHSVASLGQQSTVFEELRKRVGEPDFDAHQKILEAIQDGDGDRSEEGIIRHIDSLIDDVKKYWNQYVHDLA